MDPSELTLAPNKTILTPLSTSQRSGKVPVPRVDLESTYTQLRAALGDHWADYKTAINAFVLGNLNQAELSWVLHPLLSTSPPVTSTAAASEPNRAPLSILHLHNSLIACLYANILRDPPPSEVASWVAATDKPTSAAKNAGAGGANDQAEERLKRETMSLHARDRRRIKTLKETGTAVNNGFQENQEYRNALAVKPPDASSHSGAGALARSNLDLEVRRRYAHSLAAETLEFPTQSDVQSRIEPICYEEGLLAGAQGTLQACAELVEQATEVFLKELLGHLCSHARTNGPGFVNLSKFKKQLQKEEDDAERGVVQRNAAGLLPVEVEVQSKREPVGMDDLRLALSLEDPYLRHDPFRAESILSTRWPTRQPEPAKQNGVAIPPAQTNGHVSNGEPSSDVDAMAVDDVEFWKGSSHHERDELMGVLDDCLLVG